MKLYTHVFSGVADFDQAEALQRLVPLVNLSKYTEEGMLQRQQRLNPLHGFQSQPGPSGNSFLHPPYNNNNKCSRSNDDNLNLPSKTQDNEDDPQFTVNGLTPTPEDEQDDNRPEDEEEDDEHHHGEGEEEDDEPHHGEDEEEDRGRRTRT